MRRLGHAARSSGRVYLTGGATAVLKGWRQETIDIDIRFEPDLPELFAAIPELKKELAMNVELASPQDFIPALPDWRARSELITTHGLLAFFHYDFYAQVLAKIERGHAQDVTDVKAFFREGLVVAEKLLELFSRIEPDLVRYPALDPAIFRSKVERAVAGARELGRDDP